MWNEQQQLKKKSRVYSISNNVLFDQVKIRLNIMKNKESSNTSFSCNEKFINAISIKDNGPAPADDGPE